MPAKTSPLVLCLFLLGPLACSEKAPPTAEPSAVKKDPQSAQRVLCASPSGLSGAAAEQLAALQSRLQKDPHNIDLLVAVGQSWIRAARQESDPGLYLHAGGCAELALQIAPHQGPAENLQLLVLLNQHQFKKARERALSVLEKNPQDQMAWGSLSDAHLELGAIEDAQYAVQKMVDLKPNLPSYARASYLAWLTGDEKGARLIAKQAVSAGQEQKITEGLAWVITQTAWMFWHDGDLKGAEAGFDLALEKHGEHIPAWLGKARVALATQRFDEAQALLMRAQEKNPTAESAWLLLQHALLIRDKALIESREAELLKLGRNQDPRTLSLALSVRNVRPDEALKLAGAEFEKRPGLYTKDAYAFALARSGQAAKAATLAQEIVSLNTPDPGLMARAGFVLFQAGDVKKGRALMKAALDKNPHFDPIFSQEVRRAIAN
jgi:tetratricopeptide (TPR) repeat protein